MKGSSEWFRRVGTVSLALPDGTQAQGFGAVFPQKGEGDGLWEKEPHLLGTLPVPLYQFVGRLPEAVGAQGEKLLQGGRAYRVLRGEALSLGGRRLGEKAVLERWEEDGD